MKFFCSLRAAIVALCVFLPAAVHAAAPSALSERPQLPASEKSAPIRPTGADLPADYETLALPPYTPDAKILQMPTGGLIEKPSNQIGDFRPFVAPITVDGKATSMGRWTELTGGGLIWRVGVRSPGATGQRLHVARYALPAGARMVVYNPANIAEAFAFEGAGEDLWLPTVFNEEGLIEITLVSAQDLGGAFLELDQTIHIYAPMSKFEKVAAGACNLDATCYPAWADTAAGVCGLGTVGQTGALFCTGTLLADTDDCSITPYVLTAHHCVGTSGSANSLEFYWFFETPTCGGVPPGAPFVPRTTGGSTLLATRGGTGAVGGGNDFTLVRMANTPPNGVTYVGWTAATPPLTSEVTCLHHPRGEYKRISFGTLTNTDNPFSGDYHEVTWDDGTTEPGSSGSPLMLTATQQIVGQLWGGGASCNSPTDPDFYGRFSQTYPLVQGYVDPGPNEFGFSAISIGASEANASVLVTVTLERPAGAGGVSVNYSATAGTALEGVDFTPVNGTVNIAASQSAATFSVPLLQDTHRDDGKRIILTLSAPSCGVVSGTLGAAQVIISDDDADSDGDGISDLDETTGFYGPPTDPNLADSDRDGLTDAEEIFEAHGFAVDPNDADTDDDEIPDFFEILTGTNPTIPDAIGLNSLALPWFVG